MGQCIPSGHLQGMALGSSGCDRRRTSFLTGHPGERYFVILRRLTPREGVIFYLLSRYMQPKGGFAAAEATAVAFLHDRVSLSQPVIVGLPFSLSPISANPRGLRGQISARLFNSKNMRDYSACVTTQHHTRLQLNARYIPGTMCYRIYICSPRFVPR